MSVLSLDDIYTLCHDAIVSSGASEKQAAAVALEIMDAEAEGMVVRRGIKCSSEC